jgi:hypothetical protein
VQTECLPQRIDSPLNSFKVRSHQRGGRKIETVTKTFVIRPGLFVARQKTGLRGKHLDGAHCVHDKRLARCRWSSAMCGAILGSEIKLFLWSFGCRNQRKTFLGASKFVQRREHNGVPCAD